MRLWCSQQITFDVMPPDELVQVSELHVSQPRMYKVQIVCDGAAIPAMISMINCMIAWQADRTDHIHHTHFTVIWHC